MVEVEGFTSSFLPGGFGLLPIPTGASPWGGRGIREQCSRIFAFLLCPRFSVDYDGDIRASFGSFARRVKLIDGRCFWAWQVAVLHGECDCITSPMRGLVFVCFDDV